MGSARLNRQVPGVTDRRITLYLVKLPGVNTEGTKQQGSLPHHMNWFDLLAPVAGDPVLGSGKRGNVDKVRQQRV
jgi:hypothetical protein